DLAHRRLSYRIACAPAPRPSGAGSDRDDCELDGEPFSPLVRHDALPEIGGKQHELADYRLRHPLRPATRRGAIGLTNLEPTGLRVARTLARHQRGRVDTADPATVMHMVGLVTVFGEAHRPYVGEAELLGAPA